MFWNQKEINPPPTITFKINSDHKKQAIQIKNTIKEAIQVLSDNSVLSAEAFILKKLLYKSTNQHHHQKSIHRMKQVNNCYKRYTQMKMIEILENFKDCCYSGSDDKECYYPSRQMLQYILTRLLGMENLLQKGCAYAELGYIHCMQTLAIGNFIPTNTIFSSLLSRLWVLFKALAAHCRDWYKKLFDLLHVLKEGPVEWLPTDVTLPDSITNPEAVTKSNVSSRMYKLGMLDENMRDIETIIDKVVKRNEDGNESGVLSNNVEMNSDSDTESDLELKKAVPDYSMGFKEEELGESFVQETVATPKEKGNKKTKKKSEKEINLASFLDKDAAKLFLQKLVKKKDVFSKVRDFCFDDSCDILKIDGSAISPCGDKAKTSLRKLPFLFAGDDEFNRRNESMKKNKKARKVLYSILWKHVKTNLEVLNSVPDDPPNGVAFNEHKKEKVVGTNSKKKSVKKRKQSQKNE